MSGPPLGRKPRNKPKEKYSAGERNPVEGKFGEAKRRYGLGRIRGKLKDTSENMISMIIIIMNIRQIMRDIFLIFSDFSIYIREYLLNNQFFKIFRLIQEALIKELGG